MKKLNKIKDLIVGLNYDFKKLLEYGFVIRSTRSASSRIYIHYKKKIVVKTPYLLDRTPKSEFAIPTVEFKIPKDFKGGYSRRFSKELRTVFVQPLARRTALSRAGTELADRGCRSSDLHSGNVGWYRNKAVLIDW